MEKRRPGRSAAKPPSQPSGDVHVNMESADAYIFLKFLLKPVQRRIFYRLFVFHMDDSPSLALMKEAIISDRVRIVGNVPDMRPREGQPDRATHPTAIAARPILCCDVP